MSTTGARHCGLTSIGPCRSLRRRRPCIVVNGRDTLRQQNERIPHPKTFRETKPKTLDQDLANIVTVFVDALPEEPDSPGMRT